MNDFEKRIAELEDELNKLKNEIQSQNDDDDMPTPTYEKYSIWPFINNHFNNTQKENSCFIKKWLTEHNCNDELKILKDMENKINDILLSLNNVPTEDLYYLTINEKYGDYMNVDGIFNFNEIDLYQFKSDISECVGDLTDIATININYCNYLDYCKTHYNIPDVKENN